MIKNSIFIIIMAFFFCHEVLATEYKIAVRAHLGIKKAKILWQSTLDLLTTELAGYTFTLVPIVSLKEITERSGRAEFDFVLTNPSSYVEIEQLHGAIILSTLNNKRAGTAQNRFGGVIFTHALNADIITLKDLKNKTLMAVSEQAFGGWRVAWLEMLENGFNPYKNLEKLIFNKNKTQPEVVFAVRDGVVDVGVVRTDLLERMEAAGTIDMRYFRVINNKDVKGFPFFLSTELYPEWAFSALRHVSIIDAKKVQKVLFTITPESKAAILGKYTGWIIPQDYSGVRNLMRTLKVGSYAN